LKGKRLTLRVPVGAADVSRETLAEVFHVKHPPGMNFLDSQFPDVYAPAMFDVS
jgi:hypothetical protein